MKQLDRRNLLAGLAVAPIAAKQVLVEVAKPTFLGWDLGSGDTTILWSNNIWKKKTPEEILADINSGLSLIWMQSLMQQIEYPLHIT